MKHERIAQRAMRTFVENLEHACYGAETKADAILAVDREHASLLAENERLLARVDRLEGLLYRTATVDHLDDHSDACWCVGRRRNADHQSTCQEIRAALAGGKGEK